MEEEGSVKSSGNSSYNLPTQCLTQISLGELKSEVSNGIKKVLGEEHVGWFDAT